MHYQVSPEGPVWSLWEVKGEFSNAYEDISEHPEDFSILQYHLAPVWIRRGEGDILGGAS